MLFASCLFTPWCLSPLYWWSPEGPCFPDSGSSPYWCTCQSECSRSSRNSALWLAPAGMQIGAPVCEMDINASKLCGMLLRAPMFLLGSLYVCVCVCAITYHLRQAYVGQTAYKSLTESRQLHEQSFVLFLNNLILLFDVFQVVLHGCDL